VGNWSPSPAAVEWDRPWTVRGITYPAARGAGMETAKSRSAIGDQSADERAVPPLKVAINYRHADTQGTAWALYLKLAERFGGENVFFDNGTLRPGMRWRDEIKSRMTTATALLVLVGPRWMSSLAQHQRGGGEDFVAAEIDLGLRSGPRVTVVPVLVDDAEPPDQSALPPALKALAGCQVARLRHAYLLDDFDHLVTRLVEIAAAGPGPSQPRSEPSGPPPAPIEADATPPPRPARRDTEVPHRVAPPPDDDHYRMVVRNAEHLVVFLGAEANADDREQPWQEGCGALPDDRDLARYLASRLDLSDPPLRLAEAAQYVGAIYGEMELFDSVNEVLRVESEPGRVHRDLARLPGQLGSRYQMIVTPKYDVALEKAFREADEEFDVAVYVTPRKDFLQGGFVHIDWREGKREIDIPNRYNNFPIADDGRLERPVIVRVNGTVDDLTAGFPWEDNYVITEDHYIGYLSGRSAEEVVPIQILKKLRRANCLFLGYSITDWRLRVFLQRIFEGSRFWRAKYWAVAHEPSGLERDLWHDWGASLYQCSLTDYLAGLHAFLENNPGEGSRDRH
jgi:SIR2-like domain/TIR domain